MSMQPQDRIQWVYSSTTDQELENRYDQWADEYDRDLDTEFGWISPRVASESLAKYVAPTAEILDAGAGTGLVGEVLAKMGFTNLVAMDLSQGMLDEAEKKGVYKEFDKMALGDNLDYPTGRFDAVISVGVFTLGHAPASSLNELIRVTKPGGFIVYSIRPDIDETGGFKGKQDELIGAGKWKLTEISDRYHPLPKGEPEVEHEIRVFQVI